MIPAQPSVAVELEALSRMLGTAPIDGRLVLVDSGVVSLADAVSTDVLSLTIPRGRMLLLTFLNIESFPIDEGGLPVFGSRQQGGFVDAFNLLFKLNSTFLSSNSLGYRNYSGSVWLPFGSGTLTATVKTGSVLTPTTVYAAITGSGFLLPEALLDMLNEMATTRL